MNFSNLIYLFLFSFLLACGEQNASKQAENAGGSEVTASTGSDEAKKKNIIFFGNSLTAAYGLNPSDGFVALIQQRIDSLGLPYKAINAGLSGETTAGGKERVGWVISQPVDIFVLELGGNDALRGTETSAAFANLDTIIMKVKTKYPAAKIILAGMQAPPNLGERYTSAFRDMYPRLAQKHNIPLIPFFLEGVGGVPELNQGDRIHPNEEGQKILMENVWKVLEGLLEV